MPTALPQLRAERAFATVELPLHLNWSNPGRRFNMADRYQRRLVYEAVLTEGRPEDVLAYIDGTLLIDLWDELILPSVLRAAWDDAIAGTRDAGEA
ncbi:MAG: hypothetical protein FWD59_07670 [Micrococcales bacterium]|nr:hypothetical protein [Micrococcales bacterium]